ncbi:hypothetical protein BN946_scf184805.g5 [Trametes cinnabarina]|uniref:G-patch domain-containing protein n=1 Tax=Pycnoporus cinnabarinus TaxID=5643 RepID=A0A060S3T5_PYCCI|nr:hypothetical protein BN946_scf184805.g5 [Trametes cinnabarina]
MTSRLKRKLNDLGVDTASSKANESFCLIGTPLPPLEKSKDTGEFVPLWKQDVRRLLSLGATSLGINLQYGYFNTVGSKEGWTPSTFVSSRSDRAKKKVARPEDFMDEEDLAEIRENRKLVDEHEEMEFGSIAAEKRKQDGIDDQDPITAALAASLAPPPKDSVGAQILKKMGWRPGQGIGPRLTYAQRKRQDAGYLDPSKEVEGDEDDVDEAKKHMYPRRDIPVVTAPRKDNFHGLGYTPGIGLNEGVGYGGSGQRQPSGPQIAAGFGLGALNDADEDDIDIYDSGVGLGRSRVAFEGVDDEDQYMSIRSSARRGPSERETRAPSGITQTFRDGTPVLRGFVLSNKPVAEDRWFPGPDIPPDWKPNPRRVWEQSKNKENVPAAKDRPQTEPQQALSHAAWKNSQLSADQRGSILGETPLQAKTRSVFEYMSQKDRERLESIRNAKAEGRTSSAEPRPPSPGPPPPAPGGLRILHLHPSVAKAALQGFQPFTSDPVKQSRYTAFLTFQANHTSGEPVDNVGFGPLPGQSMEDFNRELEDYAKSATVFKPLSGAMAGRFRSAVVVETGPKIFEGLHQPDASGDADGSQEDRAEEKEEDPKMAAVRLGMYGPLTREVQPWQPARLLCKRFGVKEPEVDMTGPAGTASADFEFATTAAKRDVSQIEGIASDGTVGGASGSTPPLIEASSSSSVGGRKGGPRDLANVGLGEDETQGQDILTYQRPNMDVFKAIFASDDEDSGDEAAEPPKEETTLAPLDFFGVAKPATNPEPKAEPTPPPQPPAFTNAPLEKVDLSTFKPTFVPRSERDSRKDKADKKDKKSKEKKKAKASLVSFDVEDDGSIPSFGPPVSKEKNKERKKKRKERHEEEDEDAMWVEKPAPEVVKDLPIPPVLPPDAPAAPEDSSNGVPTEAGPPRGRKRAVDFM